MIKVLVLGGGFGGIRAVLDLEKKLGSRRDVQITMVDKADCQTFTPALYELAASYGVEHEHPFHTKLRSIIGIPYGSIFKGKNIELFQAEVIHIDLTAKHVVTSNGATISFDYLVLAFGSAVSTFGVPGADDYAFKFKTIEDGLMLADKLEELYLGAGQKQRSLPINILVGGAGFSGVELAAELAKCVVHIAHRHDIKQQNCTAISLVEAGPTILAMISEKERTLIQKRLKALGVNILVNSPIEEVGPDSVRLKDGKTLKADLIVWSAGLKSLDLFKSVVGLVLDDRGRIPINEFLQISNYPYVFAIGDNVVLIDPVTNRPIPQMAFLAIEQGKASAQNIALLIDGNNKLKKYQARYTSWAVPVGGKYAVVRIGKWNFSGFIGHIIREAIDLRYFLSVLPFFAAIKTFCGGIKAFVKND